MFCAEGVMVAERDLFLPKHPELEKIPNLHVIKALQVRRGSGDTSTHTSTFLFFNGRVESWPREGGEKKKERKL